VGIANTSIRAANIAASIARLDQLVIPHTGPVPISRQRAHRPSSSQWVAGGVVQRSSVYWRPITRPMTMRPGLQFSAATPLITCDGAQISPTVSPAEPPGVAPLIRHLGGWPLSQEFGEDIKALRAKADIRGGVLHWGLNRDHLQYMTEIAMRRRRGRRYRAGTRTALHIAGRALQGQNRIFFMAWESDINTGHLGRQTRGLIGCWRSFTNRELWCRRVSPPLCAQQ